MKGYKKFCKNGIKYWAHKYSYFGWYMKYYKKGPKGKAKRISKKEFDANYYIK